VQGGEGPRVREGGVAAGDRAALHRQTDAPGDGFAVNVHEREGFGGFAFKREAKRADEDDSQDDEQECAGCKACNQKRGHTYLRCDL